MVYTEPGTWEHGDISKYGVPKGLPSNSDTVNRVIEVMEEWAWAVEDGTANNRLPNPSDTPIPEKEVNTVIAWIDECLEYEIKTQKVYFGEKRQIYHPWDFNRLKGASRMAFVQALKKAKNDERHSREHRYYAYPYDNEDTTGYFAGYEYW